MYRLLVFDLGGAEFEVGFGIGETVVPIYGIFPFLGCLEGRTRENGAMRKLTSYSESVENLFRRMKSRLELP